MFNTLFSDKAFGLNVWLVGMRKFNIMLSLGAFSKDGDDNLKVMCHKN